MSIPFIITDTNLTDIYSRYVDMVYRICFMLLKDIPEAEDASQTVFIKLMRSNKEFENEEHLKAWLIVTAQNTCKDILKSFWKSRRTDYESLDQHAYAMKNSVSEIREKVMSLPAKYKLPVYLYYYEGYSTAEIAEMLNIKHATLRTQLRTARQNLKLMLEEER
jgi:RNA polymerase sigma-70 factor (ECF subfamily)